MLRRVALHRRREPAPDCLRPATGAMLPAGVNGCGAGHSPGERSPSTPDAGIRTHRDARVNVQPFQQAQLADLGAHPPRQGRVSPREGGRIESAVGYEFSPTNEVFNVPLRYAGARVVVDRIRHLAQELGIC